MPLASDVMNAAAVLLNDAAKTKFTFTVQLPFLRFALRDLEAKYLGNGVATLKEIYIENLSGTAFATQPTNIFLPITLWEKSVGEADDKYVPMEEKDWEPNIIPASSLYYWVWREEVVVFIGATQTRTVKMQYYKQFAAIVDENSQVAAIKTENFLAKRTAAYCAMFIGGNEKRASALSMESEREVSDLLSLSAKERQNRPVRRRTYY